jgi:hypothetical protein
MDKKSFAKLLLEHQADLSEIRSVALRFIKSASKCVDGNAGIQGDDLMVKSISREKMVELFLKTSAIVIKLIPLEHQVIGSNLIKKQENMLKLVIIIINIL